MKSFENHALAPHTTLGIGGAARRYVEPCSRDELISAIENARKAGLPFFVLGGGSNTLIDDDGYEGVVIHLDMKGVSWSEDNRRTLVTAEAGAAFDDVVAESCKKGLGGIESLSGIPGTVGGALVQNIGAYGQELADVFVSAEVLDTDSMEVLTLSRNELKFAYRSTSLKCPQNQKIVLSVTLRLTPFDADDAVRVALEHGFKKIAVVPPKTACDMRERILETRRAKGMCYEAGDIDTHSVGSFFVNPVVSQEEASRLKGRETFLKSNVITSRIAIPTFPAEGGGVKLSAAWLIEQSGFTRGYRYQDAALSSKHCLAIINPGQATSASIIALANAIAQTVLMQFHVKLNPEIIYLAPQGVTPLPLKLDTEKDLSAALKKSALFHG